MCGALSARHDGSKGKRGTEMTIHVVSATAVYTDATRVAVSQLALCGERLGAYAEASKVHPVGNYINAASPAFQQVTCDVCRKRITGR